MQHATVTLDPAFTVAPVRRRTFGSFVEHLGRCVYTGVYEPGHPTADADGLRQDVLALVRELGVSMVRYPGGNFVSGYRWEDGVGPTRVRRPDLAWHTIETNEFGTDEFLRWCARAGVEPMMAVNLGTRGVAEAVDLLEYTNHPGGTHFSDLRVANGNPKPYDVRLWCLGNELDGPWQVGFKTAREYGRLAAQTARAMRMLDPNLTFVAVGSSGSGMPEFGAWEAEVLAETYDEVDLISAHAYYEEVDGDLGSFLASNLDMEHVIRAVTATADHVGARRKSSKKIGISFDEWNVWYLSRFQSAPPPATWEIAPRQLEDVYHVADAVVVGSLLISLLRHSDRVEAAAQAQLVNVIGPIFTEPGGRAWRQTIFHPFAQASALARGEVLRTAVDSPVYETPRYGDAPLVDAVATRDEETGAVALFVVNRSIDDPVRLTVNTRAFDRELRIGDATVLADDDVYATNTADAPDRVAPRPHPGVTPGSLDVVLPPVSWSVIPLS
ncbi:MULTISPECIES: arabinosylfuranosidase ArfA [Catenuloplanes]|uniref:non-reducing end alpha-L-arabinofuranosidase n=1 Tax=Catenuloplanes niger TaxID=587534 RepID=A0AAE3ZVS5_9ACTN|nr:alpha-N-arabinofuranosidase [Catenuloplanes niger]MDR7326079.1 alpha-N-arabinofuranosidase [Catenuloplanes niger]